MRITRDRLFVAFALWAGAHVVLSGLNWRLIQFQEAFRSPTDLWRTFELEQVPGLYSALILILCMPLARRSTVFMVSAFSAFAFLTSYIAYLNSLILKLQCDGRSVCADWSVPEFGWSGLGYSVLGFVSAGVAVAGCQWLLDKNGYGQQPVLMPLVKWLQIDTAAVSASMRPLNRWVRSLFGGLISGVCAMAAASWLGQVSSMVITVPMAYALMGDATTYPEPWKLIATSYALPIVLVAAFTWQAGVITRQMSKTVRWGGVLLAVLIVHVSTIETAVRFLGQADWFQPESATTWGMILFAFILPLVQLAVFKVANGLPVIGRPSLLYRPR